MLTLKILIMGTKVNLPKRLVVVGRIMSIKTVNPEDNGKFSSDTDIVTIEQADRSKMVLNIGHSMSNSFAKRHLLFEGNFVNFDVDECLDGKTQYEDADGNVMFHTEDYLATRDFFNASEDDIRNALYPSVLKSSFDANSAIFTSLDIATIAQISAAAADKAIAATVERVIGKREAHVLADDERGVNKTDRKEHLAGQIAALDARIAAAPAALKPSLEQKKARLEAQLA